MSARRTALGLLAVLPLVAGCIASNVVAVADREVVAGATQLPFQPAGVLVLDGLYESIDIQGDAAVSLRKIWYLFSPGGAYTGAALADVDGVPSFQTLHGTWQVGAAGLSLDGQDPVPLEAAPDHLRLSAPNGTVVLARRPLQ